MPKETFLSSQLRESSPYLVDAGFRETAKLLWAAADEIEMLRELVERYVPDLDIDKHRTNENEVAARRQAG